GSHVGFEHLTLNGDGIPGVAAALNGLFGSNSWAGDIVLSTNVTVDLIRPVDFLNLSGTISGPGGLTKIGVGTLLFGGATANTYGGTTIVKDGTLLLQKTVIDGAIPGDLQIGDGVGTPLSDVVRLVGPPQIAATSDIT